MEKLKDDIQVDIRSEEVQEIMGQVPSWILRWGIVAMAGILALFFVISCFFRMPQSLTARVRLTTATPPVEIHAYSEGQLERINVSDKQSVVSGQILASVKNMADARDIMLIDSVYSLWKAGRMTTDSLLITVHDRSWQTGELQSSFFELVQSIEHYKNYIKRNYYPRKIALNKEEQSKRNRMEKDQFEEMSLNEELLTLSHKMFKRDSILFSRNVGSGDVYDKSYMVYLQNRRILIENKQMRQESELRRIEDRNAALDLKNQYEEKLSDFDRTVQNACNQWEVQVKAWKKTYLLRSSVDGVVNFMGIRSANQYVTTGELVFIILPHNPDTPIGRASLSASGDRKSVV